MRKRLLCLLTALVLVFAMPMTAFAAGSAFDKSPSGSSSSSGESLAWTENSTGNAFFIDHTANNVSTSSDFYWAGNNLEAQGLNVGTSGKGSLLAAGNNLTFVNSKIADSVRVAGNDLVFKGVVAENNMTIAGQYLSFDSTTKANGLYAFGAEITAAGTYNAILLGANTIQINNLTCAGDVTLAGTDVVIGSNVHIAGTLNIPDDAKVDIADGAVIAGTETFAANSVEVAPVQTSFSIIPIIVSCIAHILMVGLIFWLMRETLARFAEISEANWGKLIIAGLVTFFVMPLVLVLACLPIVTVPIVFLVFVGMCVVWFCSIPFVGAAYGRFIFKNMSPMTSGILLTVILTIVAYLPNMLIATMFVCTVLTAGYVTLSLNELRKKRKMEKIQNTINKAMVQ